MYSKLLHSHLMCLRSPDRICLHVVVVLPAAAKLEDVFGQIYKVLKPGGLFLSYEWVSTKDFDPKNAGEQDTLTAGRLAVENTPCTAWPGGIRLQHMQRTHLAFLIRTPGRHPACSFLVR